MKATKTPLASRIALSIIGLMLLTGAIVMLMSLDDLGDAPQGPRRVWSEEHQHWH